MSGHPPSYVLDAVAAGDVGAAVAEHLEACDACRAYVSELRGAAADFQRTADPEAFLAKVDARAAASTSERGPVVLARRRLGWISGAVLAAAAVVLFVRGASLSPVAPVGSAEVEATRFKGDFQLAAIREHAGEQSRLTSDVRVRAGDRIRVEVGVDGARPLEVGFLGTDGTWVLLLAPTILEAGTSFSEHSARFDDTPTEGWIVAGHPDAVDRARTTRDFSGVRVLRIIAEP